MANGALSRARVARVIYSYFLTFDYEIDQSAAEVSRPSTTPPQQAPEALTKKQRQNAKRNQMLKEAKADAEAERQAKLAERRRALEREQIINQSRRGGGKQTSGGMQATVDSRGKLVWD
jgi:hypothetical protein